jgi:protein TonB
MSVPASPALRRLSRDGSRLFPFVLASVLLHAVTAWRIGPAGAPGSASPAVTQAGMLHAALAPAPLTAPQAGEVPVTDGGALAEAAPGPAADGAQHGWRGPRPAEWLAPAELDVRAEPLEAVILKYPESLRGTLLAGKVRLRLYIDERGVVRKMAVEASNPPGVFDEAARQAWAEVRFSPALKAGRPVKSQKLIELAYDPG